MLSNKRLIQILLTPAIFCSGLFLFLNISVAEPPVAMDYSPLSMFSYKSLEAAHKVAIRPGVIYKLNTSPGYVSVITLPVIPMEVAVGDSGAFSEETVGRQLFIKPLTYDRKATSNIEIYTKYGLINVLLKITNPKSVTYNLNISNSLNNIFYKNFINEQLNGFKKALYKKYLVKMKKLKDESARLSNERSNVMNLILLINRHILNLTRTVHGITARVISISSIKNIYYLKYAIANNTNKPIILKSAHIYGEYGGSFFNGYEPDKKRSIGIINKIPRNIKYAPYKITKRIFIFKKPANNQEGDMSVSFHFLSSGMFTRIMLCDIPLDKRN